MTPERRRELLAAAAVGVVAFLPFARGALTGASLYFRDLALYFLPLRRLALDGLRGGEVRFWNPYLHEGVPLSLPSLGYPLDLLQLLRPDEAGISLVLALHVPLAAVAFFALARRVLAAPPLAAAGGALAYALGGFVLSSVNLYVYVQAAAWAPLVVLTLARVMNVGSGRAVAAAGLVLAVALTTTGIEIAGQGLLAGLVLGAWAREGRTAGGLARAGGALALGLLLAAPVLVLVASQVASSARGAGFETDVVLAHSVHPFTLLQVIVAGLYGNLSNLANEWWGQNFFPRGFPYVLSLYLGPAALALALVGARRRHALRTPLALLALLGLVLCLGRWAGLGPLVDALPVLRVLRYPVKAFFTAHLALALLVSLGLAHVASSDARRGWTRLALAAGALGGLLSLAALLPGLLPATMDRFSAAFFPPGLDPGARGGLLARVLGDAATGGALALAAAAVASLARAGRLRHAPLLVVALLAGDLLRAGSGLNPWVTGAFFRPSPELEATLPTLRSGRAFSCRFEESPAYAAARQARRHDHELWTFSVALETLTPAFNVPMKVPTALSPDLTMLVPPGRVLPPDDPGCRDLEGLLPRLRAAGIHHVVSLDPLAHPELHPIGRAGPERLAPLAAHVYSLAAPLDRFHVEGGQVVEAHAGNDRLEVTVESGGPTRLVVRDAWAPGWKASVGGSPVTVDRVEGRHRGVALPAGSHDVALDYTPPGLGAALATGALGLAVLLGLVGGRPRSPATTAALATALLLATPAAAEAALDPETGSYLFQVGATAVVVAAFALRGWWRRGR